MDMKRLYSHFPDRCKHSGNWHWYGRKMVYACLPPEGQQYADQYAKSKGFECKPECYERERMNWKRIDRSALTPKMPFLVTNGTTTEYRSGGNASDTVWATHWMYVHEVQGPKYPDVPHISANIVVAPDWISVNDKSPEYGQRVNALFLRNGESKWTPYNVTYCCRDKFGDGDAGRTYYWYPLPKYPEMPK